MTKNHRFRIFGGKHNSYGDVKGRKSFKGGSDIKIQVSLPRTNPNREAEESEFIEKIPIKPVSEKIALDFYSLSSLAASSRIALREEAYMKDLMTIYFTAAGNTVNDVNFFTTYYLDNMKENSALANGRYFATFLGKKVNGYSDLGGDYVEYIAQHGRPPEFVTRDSIEYPLEGLMQIAAIAKILGDLDWLGGSGGNTGFYIDKDDPGKAKAIIVDAGCALPRPQDLQAWFPNYHQTKDIKFGNQHPALILFDRLTPAQQEEFIGTLYKFVYCEDLDKLLNFIVKRDGAFNNQDDMMGGKIVLLNENDADTMISYIKENIRQLSITYQHELQNYKVMNGAPDQVPISVFQLDSPSWAPFVPVYGAKLSKDSINALDPGYQIRGPK